MHDEQGTLVADLAIRGVLQPQCKGIFEYQVVDTDALSYRSCAPQDVLRTSKMNKKRKYSQACQDRLASFTSICMSVDGLFGKETDLFIFVCVNFYVLNGNSPLDQ